MKRNRTFGETLYYAWRCKLPELPENLPTHRKGTRLVFSARNLEIYNEILNGGTVREVAPRFGITHQRCWQICTLIAQRIREREAGEPSGLPPWKLPSREASA